MTTRPLNRRVDILEEQMAPLSDVPPRVAALEMGFSELRAEMRALHEETRAEMRALNEDTRTEMRSLNQDTRNEMRILHENVISRIALLQEGLPRARRGRKR
jgi:hypothetical protein